LDFEDSGDTRLCRSTPSGLINSRVKIHHMNHQASARNISTKGRGTGESLFKYIIPMSAA
jgi:hypothetical protein